MWEIIKNKKVTFTVWWVVWILWTLVITSFLWWISVSSAENRLYTRIIDNTTRILLIEGHNENQEDKLQTHIEYSYTIKADLKKEIDKTNDKLDKIYDYMIKN